MIRTIMIAPAMQPLQIEEIFLDLGLVDDEKLIARMRQTAETTYQPVGSCKIGSDRMCPG